MTQVACVASVSVGLSTGLIQAFSLFERAKIGASAKNLLRSPNFRADKLSEKCLEWAEKPTETLATPQAA